MDITGAPPQTNSIRRTSSVGGESGSILLEKYQLGRLLGRGSFAKVFHARSLEKTDVEVAIKVIDKAAIVSTATETLILREVSAMRRLRPHPNILELREVLATKSKIYLVMELAHGGELFAELKRRRRLSEPKARRYFQQVVSALCYCHQNGVVHRDIKPQNLLLDRNGLVKITDFGLSALAEHKIGGLIHTACGTPAYTAPEVVRRIGYDGEKADAWSCGVLLYVFLIGSLPFDDGNLSNLYRAMMRGSIELPDWISKPAKFVIYKLMDPNPTTRLSLAKLFKLSWFKKSLPKYGFNGFSGFNLQAEMKPDCDFVAQSLNSPKVNAFDIILMSSGLNLSTLFESEVGKRMMRFTCRLQLAEVEEKVAKAGEELGYRSQRGKGRGLMLVKGWVVLAVEVWEVAEELWLVELRLVEGEALFDELEWEELKTRLSEIALSWHH